MTPGPNYKWVVVVMCFLMGALNYADRSAVSAVYPLLQADLSLTNLQLASIGSFFLWAYALASPLAGILGDRVSRSRVILWSLVGWSFITLLTGFVTNVHQLLATRILLGFFEAAYLPAASALLSDYHPTKTRATAIGIHSAGLSFGIVAGGTGFGYLGEHFGWRLGFFILGVAGLVLGLIGYFVLRDAPRATPEAGAAAKPPAPILVNTAALARIASFRILLLAGMTAAVGSWIFINWLPLYYRETFHLSLTGAGFAGTFLLKVASISGGITGSISSDRIAAKKPARRMLLEAVACALGAPFLLVFLGGQPNLTAVNICIFVYSFTQLFGICNIIPMTCDLLPTRLRSTALGLMNSANCLAGGIGIMVAGALKSGMGLAGVFVGLTAITLLSAGIALVGFLFYYHRDLANRETA